MSRRWLRRFLWICAALLMLPIVMYLAADAWLESSGGRRLLERELSGRIGMEVKIDGDFDLMLIPSIGMSGTNLVVGGPDEGEVFASSRVFEVSVALQPLLNRNVQVEWIRLSGGRVHPGRYQPAKDHDGVSNLDLPAIGELTVRDFRFIFSDNEEDAFALSEFSVREFTANSETPFSLAAGEDISARGFLRWHSAAAVLHLNGLNLGLGEQSVSGRACLKLSQPFSVDAELHAGVLDLDAVRQALAGYSPAGTGGSRGVDEGGGWISGINIALSVDELVSGDTLAKGVEMRMGQPAMAVCGSD